MTLDRRRAAVLVLVGLVVLAAVFGLLVVDRPRIESVENEWGTVNADRSEVETEIVVDDPLLLRVGDAAANVEYTVELNGVKVASERTETVGLGGRNDVVRTSTWVNNDRIPDWWVTHVNNDETSTVTVDPSVVLEYGGVRVPAEQWTRERTFRTDLLEPIETDRPRRFSAFDRTVLVVDETDARWGTATPERTPILAAATVTNPTPVPLPITNVEYTVRLNGIVVGRGEAARQTLVPAGSTRTLQANASIDNSRLDEWWVTHLRNHETSTLSVSFDATVEVGGVDRRLPLDFLSVNRTFDTDVFASDEPDNRSEPRAVIPGDRSERGASQSPRTVDGEPASRTRFPAPVPVSSRTSGSDAVLGTRD